MVFISRAGRWFDHQTFNCHQNKRNAKRGKIVNNPSFQFPFPRCAERASERVRGVGWTIIIAMIIWAPLGLDFLLLITNIFFLFCVFKLLSTYTLEDGYYRRHHLRRFQRQLQSFEFTFLVCHKIPAHPSPLVSASELGNELAKE